jgi:hypothetical protein
MLVLIHHHLSPWPGPIAIYNPYINGRELVKNKKKKEASCFLLKTLCNCPAHKMRFETFTLALVL